MQSVQTNITICTICERRCPIPSGRTGACGMYRNTEGAVEEIYPDHYLVVSPISVETMPVLHFYPRTKFLQISSIGCNFDCPGCISTAIVKEIDPSCRALKSFSPDTIVREAQRQDCKGIAFLMNDPLASFHSFFSVARKAKEHDLMVGCSSNTYFTEEALAALLPVLDFIHVGFKGCSENAYKECGAKDVLPVLRNTKTLYDRGIHVEVSCVHKRGRDLEVLELAKRIGGISREIPFHVMRFVPLEQSSPEEEPSIRESEELCSLLKKSIDHVYLFNSPGTKLLTTHCVSCGQAVIEREFYGPMGAKTRMNRLKPGLPHTCPSCGGPISVCGDSSAVAFQEQMFEGGYPFTRALEILEAIFVAIGVRLQRDLIRAWDLVLAARPLPLLHETIQKPETYLEMVATLGQLLGRVQEADALISYLRERLESIRRPVRGATSRPTVYYAMGKPWFCLNADRMENNLVECAGGASVNRLVPGKGRPGVEIRPHVINDLNPEIIFISSMFDSPLDDFYAECEKEGIDVRATRDGRVYRHPIPVSDFGSPRWILGLMHIANVLHPECFNFAIKTEANAFYKRFYDTEYHEGQVNLSFGKPLQNWVFRSEHKGV